MLEGDTYRRFALEELVVGEYEHKDDVYNVHYTRWSWFEDYGKCDYSQDCLEI